MTFRTDPNQINPLDDAGATVSNGNYVLKVVDGKVTELTPETTGGGGATILDRRWTPGSGETSIDEFNDGTLDSAWVRVDAASESGFISWTEDADSDVLSVGTALGTDAAAEIHGLVQPLSGVGGSLANGDAFYTHVTWGRYGQFFVGGICASDGTTHGSGVQVTASLTVSSSSAAIEHRAFTNWNALTNTTSYFTPAGNSAYIRLVKLASTNWRVDMSADGITWTPGTSFTNSLTATQIGFFGSSYGTTVKHNVAFEFLRRDSGIT